MFKKQQMVMGWRFYNCVTWGNFDTSHTTIYPIADHDAVYESIRGHSDIVACPVGKYLIVEPTTYTSLMRQGASNIKKGTQTIGSQYPQTCHYNALITETDFIHCMKYTDSIIVKAANKHRRIPVKQGYTRCTTVALTNHVFLTSDPGIHQMLIQEKRISHFVEGGSIRLSSQHHGFIGGTCGVDLNNGVWFYGSLKYHPFGDALREVIDSLGLKCIELMDAPLCDIGGILFWPDKKSF